MSHTQNYAFDVKSYEEMTVVVGVNIKLQLWITSTGELFHLLNIHFQLIV